jgi:DNA-binding MarR family transcriptional regulator
MRDLEEKAYIFGNIFALSNKLQLIGDRVDEKLTVKQWLFLAGVLKCEEGAPTLSEIAARIGSSRQNVKKMAAILEKQGFVLMEKDARDARMLRISLTDACKAHLKQREKVELRFIEDLFCGFEAHELSLLSEAIEKLEINVRRMGLKYGEKES